MREKKRTTNLLEDVPRGNLSELSAHLASITPKECSEVWRASVVEVLVDMLYQSGSIKHNDIRGITAGFCRCLNIANDQMVSHITGKESPWSGVRVLREWTKEHPTDFRISDAKRQLKTLRKNPKHASEYLRILAVCGEIEASNARDSDNDVIYRRIQRKQ